MPTTATIEHERSDDLPAPGARARHARVVRNVALTAPTLRGTHGAIEHVGHGTRVAAGLVLTGLGAAGAVTWLGWRTTHLGADPVAVASLLAETAGLVGGIAVASGLAASRTALPDASIEPRDSHWFAHSVADLVGRTRAADLHHDVRTAVRAAPRWRWRNSSDAAVVAVLLDGPRRLLMILAVLAGLLFGVSPFGVPPWWAIVGLVVATIGVSAAHVVLGRGRLRFGDRVRWTYGALGEVVGRRDVDGLAPRCWVGTLAAAVVVSVGLALRGMSDRWTHGLPAMDDDDRLVLMTIAALLLIGSLFTLATTPRPSQADAHLVARHLDERAARQTVLVGTVALAMVGLLAGVLPAEQMAEPPSTPPVPTVEVADG